MSFSKPQTSLSSIFAWHFNIMKDNSSVLFLGQMLYTLHQRDQPKCKFLRLFSARIKIHLIFVIFKQQIDFSSNFASPFTVMRHNPLCTLLAKVLYTFKKRNLSKYKFEEISCELLEV